MSDSLTKKEQEKTLDSHLNYLAGIDGGAHCVNLSEEQILFFGLKPKTIKQKVDEVKRWHEFMRGKGWSYPVTIRQVGVYLMSQIFYGNVKSTVQAKVTNIFEFLVNTEGCIPDTPLTAPRILYMRKKINYAAVAKDPTKAAIPLADDSWLKITVYDMAIFIVWFLTTLRGDSFIAIKQADVAYLTDRIKIIVKNDKVKNVEGRIQDIMRSCRDTIQTPLLTNCDIRKTLDACPVHGLPRVKFPVAPSKVNEILKFMKLTHHSVRRGAAIALRAATKESVTWSTQLMAKHFGWEAKAAKWSEYTIDFDADVMTLSKFPTLTPIVKSFQKEGTRNTSYVFRTPKKTEEKILKEAKKRWQLLHKDTVNKFKTEADYGLAAAGPSRITPLEEIENEIEFAKKMNRNNKNFVTYKNNEDVNLEELENLDSDDGISIFDDDSDDDEEGIEI